MQFEVSSFTVLKVIPERWMKEKTAHICTNALRYTASFQKSLIWNFAQSNYLRSEASPSCIKTDGSINCQGIKKKWDT